MSFRRGVLKQLTLILLIFAPFMIYFTRNFRIVYMKSNIVHDKTKLDNDVQNQNILTKDTFSEIELKSKVDASGTADNPVDYRYIDLVSKHIMDTNNNLTIPFLENYQNPCWYTTLPDDLSHMYEKNPLMFAHSDGLSRWMAKYGVVRDALLKRKAKVQLKCLPKVYLIGVHKCGTTDIFYKLMRHPQLMPGPKKELHWWNLLRIGIRGNGTRYIPTFRDYVESYDAAAMNIRNKCPGVKHEDDAHPCLTIDGSVRLLWYSPFVDRLNPNNPNLPPEDMIQAIIYKITPNAKLLVALREPVARCYSDYFYNNNNKVKDPELFHRVALSSLEKLKNCIAVNGSRYCAYSIPLKDQLEVRLQPSMYYIFLKDWLAIWPREQLFVMELWEFSANRTAVFDKVTDYLNIDRFDRDVAENMNSKPPGNYNPPSKTGEIWPETKQILTDFFQPYNDMLAGLLGDEKFRWI